jgi:hypothetical protein
VVASSELLVFWTRMDETSKLELGNYIFIFGCSACFGVNKERKLTLFGIFSGS